MTQPPSRTGSVGPPNAGGPVVPQATTPGASGQSQQNLNQIVLEYLAKKGYSNTEATLRRESATFDRDGNPKIPGFDDLAGVRFARAFEITQAWIENTLLDIYKSEVERILWPLFVYCYLQCVAEHFGSDARDFFTKCRGQFEAEHEDDLRALSAVHEPEHVQENERAQLYRKNKYRLTLTKSAYEVLLQFIDSHLDAGGKLVAYIISNHVYVNTIERAAGGHERSLARLIAQQGGIQDAPAEDEGIPGHHPGSANTNARTPTVLSKLALGSKQMEADLMEDVKAQLQEDDAAQPPGLGRRSLVEEFEQCIKPEPLDDQPTSIPFPKSTARDVAMEVARVKELRDRLRIDGHTGGVAPGVSVSMFTFHNTFDSICCIEFSGDNSLVAAGTSESYIRVWNLDNEPLTSPTDHSSYKPSSSRRLVGHSGPVYSLSFSPSVHFPKPADGSESNIDSHPRYLLSSSADATIRLWSLDTWSNLVVYRGHKGPVWDVRFSPQGHYFVSGGSDRTARLWSTNVIRPLRLLVGHDSDVDVVAWHPNTAYVFTASSGGDKTVRMWDISRGLPVRLFTGHTGNVTAMTCAPDGHTVASADDRGDIILWDLAAGRLTKRLKGHGRGGIWSVDWSVESSILVSGGADGTVRVWDVRDKTPVGTIVGEGGAGTKLDGGAATNASTTGSGKNKGKGKAKKDVTVSAEQISAFPTKKSPVYKVGFTHMNLILAAGAYMP